MQNENNNGILGNIGTISTDVTVSTQTVLLLFGAIIGIVVVVGAVILVIKKSST